MSLSDSRSKLRLGAPVGGDLRSLSRPFAMSAWGVRGAQPFSRLTPKLGLRLLRMLLPGRANSRHPRHCFPLMPPSFLHSGWTPRSHARDPARDVDTESLVLSSKRLLKRGLFVRHDE